MPDSGDWLACPRVQELLPRLDEAIEQALRTADPRTRQVASYLVGRGGKRLRPALLLLAAAFGQGDEDRLLRAAAALELIHVASLYHDDVMDRAKTRRGGESVNKAWGNTLATTGGVFLFARATALLASLGDDINHLASAATTRLCTGQLREVENAYNVEITVEEHFEILTSKTATLFELPCQLGALLGAVAQDQAVALGHYGRHLGLAFQLADDALDWVGDMDRLGKSTLTDVREGVYNFPLVHLLGQPGPEAKHLRDLLRKARFTQSDLDAVTRIVRNSAALPEALRRALLFAAQAQDYLFDLPPGPPRLSLLALAEFSVQRMH